MNDEDKPVIGIILVFTLFMSGMIVGIMISSGDAIHGNAKILMFQKYSGDTAPYRIIQTDKGTFTLSCDYFDNVTSLPVIQQGRFFFYIIPFSGRGNWELDYEKIPRGC